jgi:hypothetical protein
MPEWDLEYVKELKVYDAQRLVREWFGNYIVDHNTLYCHVRERSGRYKRKM